MIKSTEHAEYNAKHSVNDGKKSSGKPAQKVRHRKFGEGIIVKRKDGSLIVQFGKVGRKQLNEKKCLDKGLIEFE